MVRATCGQDNFRTAPLCHTDGLTALEICTKAQAGQHMPSCSPMELAQLEELIKQAGGGGNALAYASGLLGKLKLIESQPSLATMLDQLRVAKEPGDFRGRVLEVNFAYAFLLQGILLANAVKQGRTGDIDFQWSRKGGQIFFELKLLGKQLAIKEKERVQLEVSGFCFHAVDDRIDIGRLQRDIFGKSTLTKFNPKPHAGDINLLVIDVSELQLGAVDECDCVHAVCGARTARATFPAAMIRPEVFGALEAPRELTPDEANWMERFHPKKVPDPHPRTYIHGVVFIFRSPKEEAALSYELSCYVVWNHLLIDADTARSVQSAVHKIMPKVEAN